MFHTKFNIRFRRLVLLEMNCFEKIIKRALQKFAIQCKKSWYKVFVHLLLQRLVDSVLSYLLRRLFQVLLLLLWEENLNHAISASLTFLLSGIYLGLMRCTKTFHPFILC